MDTNISCFTPAIIQMTAFIIFMLPTPPYTYKYMYVMDISMGHWTAGFGNVYYYSCLLLGFNFALIMIACPAGKLLSDNSLRCIEDISSDNRAIQTVHLCHYWDSWWIVYKQIIGQHWGPANNLFPGSWIILGWILSESSNIRSVLVPDRCRHYWLRITVIFCAGCV